jgi:acyl carrier protein phosphodiesterase
MNFLAHSYLSFGEPNILVGNMISDFVKGRKKFGYSNEIQNGIQLHRDIDTFTDTHDTTREAKLFLKPAVGLYAGAFLDVAYDHFLANDPLQFTETTLSEHSSATYNILRDHNNILPDKFQQMLPFMISQNWLFHYKDIAGIRNSFAGVARRAAYIDSSVQVFDLFIEHYTSLRKCYNEFFPHLKWYSLNRFEHLLNE